MVREKRPVTKREIASPPGGEKLPPRALASLSWRRASTTGRTWLEKQVGPGLLGSLRASMFLNCAPSSLAPPVRHDTYPDLRRLTAIAVDLFNVASFASFNSSDVRFSGCLQCFFGGQQHVSFSTLEVRVYLLSNMLFFFNFTHEGRSGLGPSLRAYGRASEAAPQPFLTASLLLKVHFEHSSA